MENKIGEPYDKISINLHGGRIEYEDRKIAPSVVVVKTEVGKKVIIVERSGSDSFSIYLMHRRDGFLEKNTGGVRQKDISALDSLIGTLLKGLPPEASIGMPTVDVR